MSAREQLMSHDSEGHDVTIVNIPEPDDVYKTIRLFSNICESNNLEKIKKFLETNKITVIEKPTEETLLSKESTALFRNKGIQDLLNNFALEFSHEVNEMVFCYTAQSNKEKLNDELLALKNNDFGDLNGTKHSDSALVFALKYGNIDHPDYVECLKMLMQNGLNVNIIDFKGKTAIDHVAFLYSSRKLDKLIDLAKALLETGLVRIEDGKCRNILKTMGFDLTKYNFKEMDDQTKLFYWIIKKHTDKFLNFPKLSQFANCNNGESTLLQFTVKKSDDMQPIVRLLLRKGANPNTTTSQNMLSPIEIAALQNHQRIFEELLKHHRTTISDKQFDNFVIFRAKPIKPKYFEMLLESNKLNPELRYRKTGNTPLHYAIYFTHKKAIQDLLKRNSSLLPRNMKEKRIIDMIDASDLETYFDYCLAFDNYTPYFSDYNYKMKFRFNCLIDQQSNTEVKVIANIGKNPNLQHLLTHPLIHIFISLKWFNTQKYFWIILFLQCLIYLYLSVFFYRYPNTSNVEEGFGVFFSLVNIVVKVIIFFHFTKTDKGLKFPTVDQARFHSCVECFVVLTFFGSFFLHQFRAFVFTTMALSFLLTAGYHPKLSKWSMMLQKVFKTFTVLLIFFSLIIISFSFGFQILFEDVKIFQNMTRAILATYVMTVGEFNSNDLDFETSGFGSYLLFFIFAMSVSLVIVNFWTGVAVSDIEGIERHSEVNAFKNVIIFMLFIDYIYTRTHSSFSKTGFFKNCLPKPLLFLCMDNDGRTEAKKYEIDFHPNKENQFGGKSHLPSALGNDCFAKLEACHYNRQKITNEENILSQLKRLTKIVDELKDKISINMKQSLNQNLDSIKSQKQKQTSTPEPKFRKANSREKK